MRKRPVVRASVSGAWSITPLPLGIDRRRATGAAIDGFVRSLLDAGRLEPIAAYDATQSARRSDAADPLVVVIEPGDDGPYVAIARLPSGAVKFVLAEQVAVRGGRRRRRVRSVSFRIAPHAETDAPGRRGLGRRLVRLLVLRVLGKAVDAAGAAVARLFEEAKWKVRGLPTGLLRVGVENGQLALRRIVRPAAMLNGKCLLLVHGTFSHAAASFGKLAQTRSSSGHTLFEALHDRYRGGIYAFNHFTISKGPVENARELLASLPAAGRVLFDTITHSRGALVVRALLAASSRLPHIDRFALDRGVLVAGPNQGTPLASTERWQELVDWLGNIIDFLPDNPFTFGVEFVVELVSWLAHGVGFSLPGLAAMNPQGEFIRSLRSPTPPLASLSVVAANTEPEAGWLARAVDVGIDGFFAMPNDMVVPTAGSWRSADGNDFVPGDRIACFGPSGNVVASSGESVNHTNYFAQRETVDAVIASLAGDRMGMPPIDPANDLILRQPRRTGTNTVARAHSRLQPPAPKEAPVDEGVVAARGGVPPSLAPAPAYELDEVFNLFILQPDSAAAAAKAVDRADAGYRDEDLANQLKAARQGEALIIGSFRNARVFSPFKLKKGSLAKRWRGLQQFHDRLKGYVNGDEGCDKLPGEAELRGFGVQLFETLFPGQIRRLYDSARSEAAHRRLDVCITSNIGWVAAFPWEFAFDPSREMYLCMEEVNLLRNISTAVPASAIAPRAGALRILVVAAQPIGAGALDEAAEIEVIRRAFGDLETSGLADVEIVPRATPERLHHLLMNVDSAPVDVLHFIGHGEFDAATGFGYLLFENADGQTWRLRADNLRQIVCRRGIRLIFLNACETGMGIEGSASPLDFAQGAAPMLVAGGVPAVVANQFKVLDLSATAFAQRFYSGLAAGLTIANAAREARVSVNYAIDGEAIDWAVPVVFARNPRDQLVAGRRAPPPAPLPMELAASSERKRAGRLRKRVAFWDVNYRVPNLDLVLRQMSEAQDLFEFVRADISAPIGTWHPRRSGSTRRAALDVNGLSLVGPQAPALPRNLEAARRRLNADHLVAMTTFPIFGAGVSENLMVHTSPDARLSVISIAPVLDEFDDQLTVERLLVNFFAFALSGLDEHKRGPKNCPMFYNEKNEMKWAAGASEFCPTCARRIRNKGLKRALDALLGVFAAPP